jgi:hypothetical protein
MINSASLSALRQFYSTLEIYLSLLIIVVEKSSFIMLTVIKPLQEPFHSRTQSPCFESGFFYFESWFSKVKSGFSQRQVRIQFRVRFFSSPDFRRVRISKYANKRKLRTT